MSRLGVRAAGKAYRLAAHPISAAETLASSLVFSAGLARLRRRLVGFQVRWPIRGVVQVRSLSREHPMPPCNMTTLAAFASIIMGSLCTSCESSAWDAVGVSGASALALGGALVWRRVYRHDHFHRF